MGNLLGNGHEIFYASICDGEGCIVLNLRRQAGSRVEQVAAIVKQQFTLGERGCAIGIGKVGSKLFSVNRIVKLPRS
ncbi:MAG: hypothetical protein AAFS04_11770 [Cyanobacteria bacterium J06631_9]